MAFIVLEGLDGAGKSTQIEMLQTRLESLGKKCERLHFPRFDAPVYGELIARFLRGEFGGVADVNPYLVALLYAGDRAEASSMIRGWLADDKVVIADRYVYSNIGYQCAKLPEAEECDRLSRWIFDLEYGHFNIPRPDVSVFLDVPFKFTADKLAASRSGDDRGYLHGASDIHEASLDLQSAVRRVYLNAAKSDDTLSVVDCSDSAGSMDTAQNIADKIWSVVSTVL